MTLRGLQWTLKCLSGEKEQTLEQFSNVQYTTDTSRLGIIIYIELKRVLVA